MNIINIEKYLEGIDDDCVNYAKGIVDNKHKTRIEEIEEDYYYGGELDEQRAWEKYREEKWHEYQQKLWEEENYDF